MDKIYTLMKEIEQRIAQLETDKLIDSSKKAILIRENKRFSVRCQQLFLSAVSEQLPLDKLRQKLDEALAKETPETLIKWLEEKRQ